MTTPLHAAVLASAVAFLPLPAAAQGDAGFAAALGRLPSGLAVTAELKAQPQRPAADDRKPLRVDEEAYERILIRALHKGTPMGSPAEGWKLVEQPPDSPVTLIAIAAGTELADHYEISEIGLTIIRPTRTATGISFENHSFVIKDHTLVEATSQPMFKKLDGEIIVLPVVQLDHLDPAVQREFLELFNWWAK